MPQGEAMKLTKAQFALAAARPRAGDPPAEGIGSALLVVKQWREFHTAAKTITPGEAKQAGEIEGKLADLCLELSARFNRESEKQNPKGNTP